MSVGKHETLERKTVFEGKVLRLYLDRVRLPDGVEAEREVVLHWGAVGMVPLDERGGVFLVRQYRHATGKDLLEIPAGKLAEKEDPLRCARRELMEEIGYDAGEFTALASFYTSPGFSDEKLHLYLARDLRPASAEADEDEFLEVVHMPLTQAMSMISRGEIEDSKTIVGISLTVLFLRGEYDHTG